MDQCQAKLTHLSENFPTDTLSSSSNSNSNSILEAVQFLSSGSLRIEPPENPGRSPRFNSNNLLLGDAQSSLPIALMIGSDNPHSTFSVDAADTDVDADAQEEDLYSREAKEQAARERAEEAANSMALTVVTADSALSLMMDVQHQSSKRPRPLSPPSSPERLEKVQLREASLDTSPCPSTIDASEKSTLSKEENGTEAAPEQPPDHRPFRRASRFQTAQTTPETVQPALEDRQPAEEVQAFCHLLVDFRTSLSQGMRSILSNLSHAPLRPGLEGLASTALTALLGLEKSLQPLCPSSAPPLSTSPLPLLRIQSSPVEESPGVPPPSAPSLQGATPTQAPPPSLGPHAVTPLSWAKVVGNSTQAPPQTGPADNNSNVWTPVRRRNSRGPMQRTVAESGVTSSSTSIPLDSRGPTPPHGPPGTSGPSSPRGGKNAAETGSRFARGLRAARTGLSSPEERTRAFQKLLFATPRSDPAAMDTGAAGPPIDQTRKPRDEPVTFLHVNCPNFSDAARKEPKAAWRHLLLALSPEGSPLRPLDILPMSATTAEIFLPEAQLSLYREVLQQYLMANTPPLSEKDFRRRAAAYRNSYYRAYRQATLQGFPKFLQSELLVHIQTDAYTVSPPPTKYPDILRIVEMDMAACRDPLPAFPTEV